MNHTSKHRLLIILAAALLITLPGPSESRTWYVTVNGTGDVPTIQAGIDSAVVGDTVLVGPGRYTWTNQGTGTDYGMILFYRDVTGFAVISEAGPELTVLDAEQNGRNVYIMAYNDIVIDGFTITGGRAPISYDGGGGLIGHLSAPTIRNCVFTANYAQQGGGVWYGGVSAPVFENCVFEDNEAELGGGVCLVNSSTYAVFTDCIISHNRASHRGGGMVVYNYGFEMERCTIHNNTATVRGGGIHLERTNPSTITNCTIAENGAPEGGGMRLFWEADLTVEKTIICKSSDGAALTMDSDCMLTVECCDIFGNADGDTIPADAIDAGYNIFLDPQFCGVGGTGNYTLQNDSPCLPFNNPGGLFCGLIGAHDVACGGIAVEEKSWSTIKGKLLK
jgi:parallel beta-helix repeat protein